MHLEVLQVPAVLPRPRKNTSYSVDAKHSVFFDNGRRERKRRPLGHAQDGRPLGWGIRLGWGIGPAPVACAESQGREGTV